MGRIELHSEFKPYQAVGPTVLIKRLKKRIWIYWIKT